MTKNTLDMVKWIYKNVGGYEVHIRLLATKALNFSFNIIGAKNTNKNQDFRKSGALSPLYIY